MIVTAVELTPAIDAICSLNAASKLALKVVSLKLESSRAENSMSLVTTSDT